MSSGKRALRAAGLLAAAAVLSSGCGGGSGGGGGTPRSPADHGDGSVNAVAMPSAVAVTEANAVLAAAVAHEGLEELEWEFYNAYFDLGLGFDHDRDTVDYMPRNCLDGKRIELERGIRYEACRIRLDWADGSWSEWTVSGELGHEETTVPGGYTHALILREDLTIRTTDSDDSDFVLARESSLVRAHNGSEPLKPAGNQLISDFNRTERVVAHGEGRTARYARFVRDAHVERLEEPGRIRLALRGTFAESSPDHPTLEGSLELTSEQYIYIDDVNYAPFPQGQVLRAWGAANSSLQFRYSDDGWRLDLHLNDDALPLASFTDYDELYDWLDIE